jgi:hypothetical protein
LSDEVAVGLGLLERRLPVLTDHHERREEDRSSDTIRVSFGHGSCPTKNIHSANTTA